MLLLKIFNLVWVLMLYLVLKLILKDGVGGSFVVLVFVLRILLLFNMLVLVLKMIVLFWGGSRVLIVVCE